MFSFVRLPVRKFKDRFRERDYSMESIFIPSVCFPCAPALCGIRILREKFWHLVTSTLHLYSVFYVHYIRKANLNNRLQHLSNTGAFREVQVLRSLRKNNFFSILNSQSCHCPDIGMYRSPVLMQFKRQLTSNKVFVLPSYRCRSKFAFVRSFPISKDS
jgi:hypothetical protein